MRKRTGPQVALTKTQKLVERDWIHALIGYLTTSTYAARGYVTRQKLPTLTGLGCASLVLGLSLAVPAARGQEREPVRLGIIYTNTGPLAQLGIDMRDGALLYWSQIGNRAGGRRVEVFTESTGDPALGIIASYHWSAALDLPENRRVREAFESKHKRPMNAPAEQGYVGSQMIAKALEAVKGDVKNLDAVLAVLRKIEIDAPRGKVKLDAFHNPVQTVYVFRTERKGGALQNVPIASYPNVSQFWTWSPEEFMAMPSYVDLKGKWAK